MNIKFKFKDKSETYENISKPRRYKIHDRIFIQFLKNGRFIKVYVTVGDKYEVEE